MVWDYRTVDLSPADRALCDHAVKLTLAPGRCGAADLERLRTHGLDDAALTIATQVIGYFNSINRIAEGLGVDPEPWMTLDRDRWLRDKARFALPD